MKMEFTGTYKNDIVEKEPLYLNTIIIKRNDGKIVTIDRDETNYTIENGIINILFRGFYEWSNDQHYPKYEDIELYDNATIIQFEIEDDAPKNYDLIIRKQKVSVW